MSFLVRITNRALLRAPSAPTPRRGGDRHLVRLALGLAGVALVSAVLAACGPSDPVSEGRRLVGQKGCTGCHIIPGAGGNSSIGPSLAGFASRPTIVGAIPNTRENLAQWITNPSSLKPGTSMPSLPLSPAEVNAIVAFLQTLK
ncbi:MAG: hypothetical protein KatS3mg060_0909 [Dehalococcoidia bacterium]|nr:MAG: hypothetical protein KatS3mg060_0909 [Dehalococcoidia bacterium]